MKPDPLSVDEPREATNAVFGEGPRAEICISASSAGCKAKVSGNAHNKVSTGYLCSVAGDKANTAFLGKRVYILVENQLDATGKETGRETLAERRWVGAVEKLAVALNDGYFLVLRHESENQCARDKWDLPGIRP